MEIAEQNRSDDEAVETVRQGVVNAWKDGKILALRLNAAAPDLMLSWSKPTVLPASSWAEVCHVPGMLRRLRRNLAPFAPPMCWSDPLAPNSTHPRVLMSIARGAGPVHKDAAALLRPSDGPIDAFKIQVGELPRLLRFPALPFTPPLLFMPLSSFGCCLSGGLPPLLSERV